MPFPPMGIDDALTERLQRFAEANRLDCLLESYAWNNDRWCKGFPDILVLEKRLVSAAREQHSVRRADIQDVADWGTRTGRKRGKAVKCSEYVRLHLYEGNLPLPDLARNPDAALDDLREVDFVGPTYKSKVLRFAMPGEYGAIDTNVVRVFGGGGCGVSTHGWLKLRVTKRRDGPYIRKEQRAWPSDYGLWINILRYFAQHLTREGVACPHPEAFIESGLREPGRWACADVEMALFAYALGTT